MGKGTKEMRIGMVCPIGHLDCQGYQHTSRTCIENQRLFADKIYLISSIPGYELAGIDLVHISDKRTWFKGGIFDIHQIIRNANMGRERAIADGMDCVIYSASNWYISELAGSQLRDSCRRMLQEKRPWGWLYR
jgi:hypothetical protein